LSSIKDDTVRASRQSGQLETPASETLVVDDEAAAVPKQDLHPIPTLADEDKEVAGEGVERECAAHERTESVVPTPQVDGLGGQVHLGAGCNAQHDDRNAPTSAAM